MAFSNPGRERGAPGRGRLRVVARRGRRRGGRQRRLAAPPTYPAGLSKVVGVGATAPGDAVASFSNQSAAVFIARARRRHRRVGRGRCHRVTGTSASAAVVAGRRRCCAPTTRARRPATIVGRLAAQRRPDDRRGSGNGRVNLARAIADTSTAGVSPPASPAAAAPSWVPTSRRRRRRRRHDRDARARCSPDQPATRSVRLLPGQLLTFNSSSQMSFVVPAGWTAPQTSTRPTRAS